jgi:hypothetical protein
MLLFFLLVYASCLFILLGLLYPEPIVEGFDSLVHLLDNRKWFFGTLFAVALLDLADTWIKHLNGASQGELQIPLVGYIFLMSIWIVMSGIAIFVTNRLYHAFFAVIFFVAVVIWSIFALPTIT